MLTVDEQLEEALAKLRSLEADASAREALLTEAAAKTEALTAQVTELQTQRERIDADLASVRQNFAALTKRNEELEAAENDIEKRAAKRAAEIVASTGTTAPAPVTPKGDHQTEDLVSRFKAIADPKEQTLFWRSLTPQQQALILTNTATAH